jgi:uncharacterized damage-inducible protein DinB
VGEYPLQLGMAPPDLLRPLEGQREETLRIVEGLGASDLDRTDRGTGWTVRQLCAHLVAAELGEAFVIRRALDGEVMHLSQEDRDSFNDAQADGAADWDAVRVRSELADALGTLREVFEAMTEEDLDRAVRWPEWPARTIRTSIPYMVEHEDSHLDQIKGALRD